MCGVPVHAAESYLARLIKAGHRVAIAEQIESPAEARKARGSKALVERAIIRLVTPGTLTEETLLEFARAPTGWRRSAAPASDWAIAAADISTGRFELVSCGPGELAAELARLRRPKRSPTTRCRASATGCRQGRVRQPRRRARAQGPLRRSRRWTASARRRAPSWPRRAGCSPISTRPQKGAGILLDAPRRIAARQPHGDRRRDAATVSSSPRSVCGSVAGSLLGEIDRCQTAAGAPPALPKISRAPLTDRRAIEHGWRWSPGCTKMRSAASALRAALKAMPDFARALGAAGRGARQPARSGAAARRPGSGAALKRELAASPIGRRCSTACCRGWAATARWSSSCRERWSTSPPIDASKGGYIAEGYDAALDALRDAGVERPPRDRRARGPLPRPDRHQLAQDPPQRRARLSCRSVGAACRQADGARQRLHPPPDPRRRRPLQLARAARGGEPGGRGGQPCARRRSRACRGADRARASPAQRRSPRPPKRSPGIDVAASHAHRAAEGGWTLPQLDRPAVPGDRSGPPSGRRSRACATAASASSPTTCRSGREPTGCG